MRKIKGFDKVLLKDGREADVVDTISVIIDDIEKNRCKRIIGFDECFFY